MPDMSLVDKNLKYLYAIEGNIISNKNNIYIFCYRIHSCVYLRKRKIYVNIELDLYMKKQYFSIAEMLRFQNVKLSLIYTEIGECLFTFYRYAL